MKSLGIMQAYFMPYIGYFQLIDAVDEFVIYDNIQYTKKGWINRNRILVNGTDKYITLPLKKDSDFLDIRDRFLAETFDPKKLLCQIKTAYHKAPHFPETYALLETIIPYPERNLFQYIYFSVAKVCEYLGISTPIIISSHLKCDHTLKSQEKVIAICKERQCDRYINAIGGMQLYCGEDFAKENIELCFIETERTEYPQFQNEFLPSLSIIDVLMFNSIETIRAMLQKYRLRKGEAEDAV